MASRFRWKSLRDICFCLIACLSVLAVSVAAEAQPADPSPADSKATEAAGAKVEARGLRVVGEGYGGEGGVRPFNWSPGVNIALLVTVPDGGLIEFDHGESEVTKLVDEKGTNLLVRGEFSMPGFSGMDEVSADGMAMIIEVSAGGIPAKGASAIHAAGTLALRQGSEQKTYKAENVAVKADQTIDAGPVAYTIKSVGKPDWGDKPLRITLETKQSVDAIAGIRFLDAAGAEIESSRAGSMTMSAFDEVQVTEEYDLAREVDQVTVEITYWMDLKTVKVPFDVTVRVGL
jgi:hypothetical protein